MLLQIKKKQKKRKLLTNKDADHKDKEIFNERVKRRFN